MSKKLSPEGPKPSHNRSERSRFRKALPLAVLGSAIAVFSLSETIRSKLGPIIPKAQAATTDTTRGSDLESLFQDAKCHPDMLDMLSDDQQTALKNYILDTKLPPQFRPILETKPLALILSTFKKDDCASISLPEATESLLTDAQRISTEVAAQFPPEKCGFGEFPFGFHKDQLVFNTQAKDKGWQCGGVTLALAARLKEKLPSGSYESILIGKGKDHLGRWTAHGWVYVKTKGGLFQLDLTPPYRKETLQTNLTNLANPQHPHRVEQSPEYTSNDDFPNYKLTDTPIPIPVSDPKHPQYYPLTYTELGLSSYSLGIHIAVAIIQGETSEKKLRASDYPPFRLKFTARVTKIKESSQGITLTDQGAIDFLVDNINKPKDLQATHLSNAPGTKQIHAAVKKAAVKFAGNLSSFLSSLQTEAPPTPPH